MDECMNTNRDHWNGVVSSHVKAPSYDVDGFRAGETTLRPIELEEVGDVSGKSLLHLQCHFGLDTMSWARLGARATGVDFSDEAISTAQSLSSELGLDARFICSNVYDLPDVLDEQFDVVFTSYGVLAWLPDLDRWAQTVAHFVKPGGTFHIAEIHPIESMMEYDADTDELRWEYPYFFQSEALRSECAHTYAAENAAANSPVTYEWCHSLGEIVTSLINAGLTIEYLHEFPFCCYQPFPCMTKDENGWWRLPEKYRDIPLLFSIKARNNLSSILRTSG